MSAPYDEAELERAVLDLFADLGWATANGYEERFGPTTVTGRETLAEAVLVRDLRQALMRLNPGLPAEAITGAVEKITEDRSVMEPTRANRDVYQLLKDGVRVRVRAEDGAERVETVRVVDWNDASRNSFLVVSQLWMSGQYGRKRADLVGFVNGIPLVFVELKVSHRVLKAAYDLNLTDYKTTIPQLFWLNGLIILSNGSETKVGSVSAEWGHFAEWKKVGSEDEPGAVSVETAIRGTCDPARLLDLVENFVAFTEMRGGLVKVLAKNHQYLGVNAAMEALRGIKARKGRLGVFWHTQGSGKSLSMMFFSQKVLRKVPGNWTFVVVTDRIDLDDQIYKTFQDSGVVTEKNVQAEDVEHLRRLLAEDHRYVFTLIHKFHTERGARHPVLSGRSDVVVITDEAHRSQYDVLALNMRNALPNASYLAFTGTPLIVGEERTREVFGDYVSVYNFRESITDGATVPLYYENRIPELQLVNEAFNEGMAAILGAAELDEEQEKKLEREFTREYHLITRDERLERIARDIVEHFMGRGFPGKAMVVSIDKATAIRMYDKVKVHWATHLDGLRERLAAATDLEADELRDQITLMETADMAVVVSQGLSEIAEMEAKGLDIRPHRKRMVAEELDEKFKDPKDPFRIVFVCAMWMTGFDVPCCSTIYLDRPMKNHTLIQTIARANRVFPEKNNGLIVDYIGVFRDLERALAIYAAGPDGDQPIKPKAELLTELKAAIGQATDFLAGIGVDFAALLGAEGLSFISLRDTAVEAVLTSEDTKRRYMTMAALVDRLYRAVLPDPAANEHGPTRALLVNLALKIRSLQPPTDISEVMDKVGDLLDDSVAAKAYIIRAEEDGEARPYDLSKIDFDALAEKFRQGRKHTEAERLRRAAQDKVAAMVRLNPTRMDYQDRLQQMIEEYNSGSRNIEDWFNGLVEFIKELTEEEQRGISEGLDEEELALFDLLTRPEIPLTERERAQVKAVAHDLLETLKRERLVLDWRKKQEARAAVRVTVAKQLDHLPATYTRALYAEKVERVYQHVFDAYFGEGRSIYGEAA